MDIMSTYRLYEKNGDFVCEGEFYDDEIKALEIVDFVVVKVGVCNE